MAERERESAKENERESEKKAQAETTLRLWQPISKNAWVELATEHLLLFGRYAGGYWEESLRGEVPSITPNMESEPKAYLGSENPISRSFVKEFCDRKG